MPQTHPMETRATKLAGAMKARIGVLAQSMTAGQGRVPFHTLLSENKAIADFWVQHRYDALGAKVLATMKPMAIADLDTALTKYAQSQQQLGMPVVSDPMQGGMND
jgi:hypothetical protein